MVIEKLFNELELLLSDIVFAGLRNSQPVIIDKLATLQQGMKELQMMEGCLLVEELRESLILYHTGKGLAEESANKLCSLEFYVRTVLGNVSG